MKKSFNVPFLTTTIFLTAITAFLMSIYSTAHWSVLANAYQVRGDIEYSDLSSEQKVELTSTTQEIIDAGHKVLRVASLYTITGILALIVSLVSIFKGQGTRRFIPLPFGLIAGLIGIIKM